MIIDNSIKQGTYEWLVARCGVVTASALGNIITPLGKMKAADQRRNYAYKLAAEHILGEPLDPYQSLEMFKGKALEGEARAAYTLLTGNKVEQVGMIFMDETRRIGGSPDGLIGNKDGPVGGCEIKNVSPNTQVEYLYIGGVPAKYKPQVFGSLYISDLEYWDFFSNSIGMPPHLVRVTADDEEYQKFAEALEVQLPKFVGLLDEILAKVQE